MLARTTLSKRIENLSGLKERKEQEERKIGEKKNGALAKEPEARMVETTTEEVKFIKAELISAREFRDH